MYPFKQVANETQAKQGNNSLAEVGQTLLNSYIFHPIIPSIARISTNAHPTFLNLKNKGDQMRLVNNCPPYTMSPLVTSKLVAFRYLNPDIPIIAYSIGQTIGKIHDGGFKGAFFSLIYQSKFLGLSPKYQFQIQGLSLLYFFINLIYKRNLFRIYSFIILIDFCSKYCFYQFIYYPNHLTHQQDQYFTYLNQMIHFECLLVFLYKFPYGRMIKPINQINVKPRISGKSSRKNSIAQHGNTQARLNSINLTQTIQCRICLQENHQSNKPFIKPCLCSGSVRFVHKQCLSTWIKQRINKANPQEQYRVIEKKAIECQMCKSEIPFSFEYKLQQIKLRQIFHRIQAKPCVSLLLFTSLTLVIFGLGFVGLMMKKFGIDFTGDNKIESIVLTVSMILLPFFFVLIMYLILDEFVLVYQFMIELTGSSHEIFLPASPHRNKQQPENSIVVKRVGEEDTDYNLGQNRKVNQQSHNQRVSRMIIEQLQ